MSSNAKKTNPVTETTLKTINSKTLLNDFIAPCKQAIENDHKEVLTFEKNYKRDKEGMRQEILKLEAKTRKAGKKTTPEVLKQQITELNDKIKESDQLNSNKLRDVVLMERRKMATFLSQFNQVLDKEIDLAGETSTKLSAGVLNWKDLINVQNQNAGAAYDTYDSYDSYDNYDEGGYNDASAGTDYNSGGAELQARALYDYDIVESTDLCLRAGDIISVIQQDDGSGWTKGRDYNGNEAVAIQPS
eukprot:gene5274-6112_t